MRERVTAGQFDAALVVVNASLHSRMGVVPFFGANSFIGYSNNEVARLLDELTRMLHPDEIDRIHERIASVFQRDLPVTFLYPFVETAVTSRRIRGLSTPYRADVLRYMADLWLEETHRRM